MLRTATIPKPRYEDAVVLFNRRSNFTQTTHGVEDSPHPGALRGGQDGIPEHMRGNRRDATAELMQAKEPYNSVADKLIGLAAMHEIESTAIQEKIYAALPEARCSQHSRLFIDGDNQPSPVWGVKMIHDTGSGMDADYGCRLSDPRTWAIFDGRVYGRAQSGGSGGRGATRHVVVGSAEEARVMTEAADTTEIECTMVVCLYDLVVAVARRYG